MPILGMQTQTKLVQQLTGSKTLALFWETLEKISFLVLEIFLSR